MRDHVLRGGGESRVVERLVVAPHADDEVLGCGGLLAKYSDSAAVVVLAEPDARREAECRAAQAVLGYPHVYFLDFPDGHLDGHMRELVEQLDEVLGLCRPQELFLPFPSLHQDHVAGYEAGMRSARLSMTEGHHFPPSVMVYDVAAYDTALYPSELRWNLFEALDEEHIDKKVRAVEAYRSEHVTGPHPVNALKVIAQGLGAPRRLRYAEQYALVREVRLLMGSSQTRDGVTGATGRVPAQPRPTVSRNGTARPETEIEAGR